MTFCLSWVFATANSVNQIFLPYLIKRVYAIGQVTKLINLL